MATRLFNLSDEFLNADLYLDGYCLELAFAIDPNSIYYIQEYGAPRSNSEPDHYVVKIGPDSYLDIEGIWTENTLLQKWLKYQISMSMNVIPYFYKLLPLASNVILDLSPPPEGMEKVVARIKILISE